MKQNKPWYCKMRRFIIPSGLMDYIKDLPQNQQINYCFIVTRILIATKKNPKLFGSIHSKVFQNFIISEYTDYVYQLVTWGVIEVRNEYSNNLDHPFTTAYRITELFMKQETKRISFQKKKCQPLKDKSTINDNITKFVYHNLKRIGVLETIRKETNLIDQVDYEDWAEAIWDQVFNLHYGKKVSRLYHSIILMPSGCRKNLILKENPSKPLFEYDVKSCHPVLLLTLMQDKLEREKFITLLNNDIYTTIGREVGCFCSRDEHKIHFLHFINGGITNYFYHYFLKHLPKTTSVIMDNIDGMASYLQNNEANIMVKLLPSFLANPNNVLSTYIKEEGNICWGEWNPENILYIPQHDGWIGLEEDEEVISRKVKELFYNFTGYNITITKTDLQSGVERILV